MRLASFTFHPHPIQVDGRPLHGVRVDTDGVTDIQLHEGVLIVSRGPQVWFTHTSYGTGVPAAGTSTVTGPYIPSEVGLIEQKSKSPDASVRQMDTTEYLAGAMPIYGAPPATGTRKQRSKKQ